MASAPQSNDVSVLRLNLLRAVYLVIALGMGLQTWPQIITGSGNWAHAAGTVKCMFGALTLLCLVGLRHPLKMLPLLFWEIAWKTIWLVVIALPAWRSGTMDAETAENAFACALVALVYAAIPWRYVVLQYFAAPAERWSKA